MEESSITVKDKFEYKIGEKTYIQKSLVLGQMKLLTNLLKTIDLPKTVEVIDIVNAIQAVIGESLSIVLIEESMLKASPEELSEYFSDSKRSERSKFFEWHVGADVLMNVVNDFLACTPVTSMFSLIRMLITNMYVPTVPTVTEETESTGLTESAST